jgi:hypothetical protein
MYYYYLFVLIVIFVDNIVQTTMVGLKLYHDLLRICYVYNDVCIEWIVGFCYGSFFYMLFWLFYIFLYYRLYID